MNHAIRGRVCRHVQDVIAMILYIIKLLDDGFHAQEAISIVTPYPAPVGAYRKVLRLPISYKLQVFTVDSRQSRVDKVTFSISCWHFPERAASDVVAHFTQKRLRLKIQSLISGNWSFRNTKHKTRVSGS